MASINNAIGLTRSIKNSSANSNSQARPATKNDDSSPEAKYWFHQLENIIPVQLPYDGFKSSNLYRNYASVSRKLESGTVSAVKKFIKSFSTNSFIFLETISTTLIHRYSQQNDLSFRVELRLNRAQGIDSLSRSKCDPQMTFSQLLLNLNNCYQEFLPKVQDDLIELAHSIEPKSLNVKLSGPFDFKIFNKKSFPKPCPLKTLTKSHQLEIEFDETGETSILINFNFNSGLFEKTSISRFADHFMTLIESALENPEAKIVDLRLISPEESALLASFNRRHYSAELNGSETFLELFAESVKRNANRFAIKQSHMIIGYAPLNAKVNQLARFLLDKYMVPKGSYVAILLPPTIDFFIALLAVLKTGGIAVPLGRDCSPQWIKFVLNHCDRPVLVTKSRLAKKFGLKYGKIVDMTSLQTEHASVTPYHRQHGDITHLSLNDIACCFYTSKSTVEKPKRVLVRHETLSYMVKSVSSILNLNPETRACPIFNSGHLAWLLGSLPALIYDGQVILPDPGKRYDPAFVANWLRQNRINFALMPTRLAQVILNDGLLRDYSGSIDILVTGTALRPVEITANIRLINFYGMTELLPLTVAVIDGKSGLKRPTIGKPYQGVSIQILDSRGTPSPIGVVGEIFFESPFAATRHQKSNEDKVETFLNDGSSGQLIRTNDLGRWREDGSIDFMGRIDSLFDVNGMKVNPAHIEDVLASCSNISRVIVSIQDGIDRPEIVAHVVPKNCVMEETTQIEAELQTFMANALPRFLIPKLVLVDRLPVYDKIGKSGKINPTRSINFLNNQSQGIELHKDLIECWSKFLDVPAEKITLDSNFYELGGDSLLAESIANHLMAEPYRLSVNQVMIMKFATIRKLSEAVCNHSHRLAQPIPILEKRENIEMSHQQRLVAMLEMALHANGSTHEILCLTLPKSSTVEEAERAINVLIERHEALRISFHESSQLIYRQKVKDYSFQKIQSRKFESTSEVYQYCSEMKSNLNEIFQGGIGFQFCLAILPNASMSLLMAVSGTLIDSSGLKIFSEELINLLESFSSQRTPDLPELKANLLDYIAWEYEFFYGDKRQMEEAEKFWTHRLKDFKQVPLPGPVRSSNGTWLHSLTWQGEKFNAINSMVRKKQSTLYILGKALICSLIKAYTGVTDVTIQTKRLCRNHHSAVNIVGNFTSLNYTRTRWNGDLSFDQLLSIVHSDEIEEQAYKFCPFARLCDIMMRDGIEFIPITYVQDLDIHEFPEFLRDCLQSRPTEGIFIHLVSSKRKNRISLTATFNGQLFPNELCSEFMENLDHLMNRILANQSQQLDNYFTIPTILKITPWSFNCS